MDEKRPKRGKDKYNPYTLTKIEDKHILSFRDGQGVLQEITINRELFELLDRFELDDLSFLKTPKHIQDYCTYEMKERYRQTRSFTATPIFTRR